MSLIVEKILLWIWPNNTVLHRYKNICSIIMVKIKKKETYMKRILVIVLMMSGGIIYPAAVGSSVPKGTLVEAVLMGEDLETIRGYLDHGASPDEVDEDSGDTSLIIAVRNDNEPLAILLMANRANPWIRNRDQQIALNFAAKNSKMYQLLSDHMEARRVMRTPPRTFRTIPSVPSAHASPEQKGRNLASPSSSSDSRPGSAAERAGSTSPELRTTSRRGSPIRSFRFTPEHQEQSERNRLGRLLQDYEPAAEDVPVHPK
jgi:hypothetical protein